ncbi:MAG TPA: phosphotransferase [Chloroflexia bacterium]|nr:phosphotransferase [Chloroflexia bacterium]
MPEHYKRKERREASYLVRLALEQYGLVPSRVQRLTDAFNTVYRIEMPGGVSYILRLNRPGRRNREEIENEIAWLQALLQDTSLTVPRPLPARTGDYLVTLSLPEWEKPRYAVLFEWLPGRHCTQGLQPLTVRKMGRAMATLHEHSLGWRPPHPTANETLDQAWPYARPAALLTAQPDEWFPPDRLALYQKATHTVEQALQKMYSSQAHELRLLHGDMHPGNIKLYGKNLNMLDFDDSLKGFPVQDVGVTMYYLQNYSTYTSLRSAFEQGYTEIRNWPEEYPGQLEIMMIARELRLFSSVLNSTNPTYPARIPGWLERAEPRLKRWLDRQENL